MRRLLYTLLIMLFSPFMLVGMLFYMVPVMMGRGKVSGTAYEPFHGRLMYHFEGSRYDAAALQLASGLPATNVVFMWFCLRPIVWAAEWSGHYPRMLNYPPSRPTPVSSIVAARCQFFDGLMVNSLRDCEQVVILGAGWDSRAYGLLLGYEVAIYEVDTPATQQVKRKAIQKSGIDDANVTFVSCDFNQQSWLQALEDAGFNATKRTFILWEGVTMYLHREAVENTLRAVSQLPEGSGIAFDFFTREWLDSKMGMAARKAVVATYGESFEYGIVAGGNYHAGLVSVLEANGLSLNSEWWLGLDEQNPIGGLAFAVNK